MVMKKSAASEKIVVVPSQSVSSRVLRHFLDGPHLVANGLSKGEEKRAAWRYKGFADERQPDNNECPLSFAHAISH